MITMELLIFLMIAGLINLCLTLYFRRVLDQSRERLAFMAFHEGEFRNSRILATGLQVLSSSQPGGNNPTPNFSSEYNPTEIPVSNHIPEEFDGTTIGDTNNGKPDRLHQLWNYFWFGQPYLKKGESLEFVAVSTWLTRIGVIVLTFSLGYLFYVLNSFHKLSNWSCFGGILLLGLLIYLFGLWLWVGTQRLMGQALGICGCATLYTGICFGKWWFQVDIPLEVAQAMSCAVILLMMFTSCWKNSYPILFFACVGAYLMPIILHVDAINPYIIFPYLIGLLFLMILIRRYKTWRIPVWISLLCTYAYLKNLMDQNNYEPMHMYLAYSVITFICLHFCSEGHWGLRKNTQVLHQENGTDDEDESHQEIMLMIVNAAVFAYLTFYLISHSLLYGEDELMHTKIRQLIYLGLSSFFILRWISLCVKKQVNSINAAVCAGLSFFTTGLFLFTLSLEWWTCLLALLALVYLLVTRHCANMVLTWFLRVCSLLIVLYTFFFCVAYTYDLVGVFINRFVDQKFALPIIYSELVPCMNSFYTRVYSLIVPGLAGIGYALIAMYQGVTKDFPKSKEFSTVCGFFSCMLVFAYLTCETCLIGCNVWPARIQLLLTVVWLLYSLVLLASGVIADWKRVRCGGLVLMLVVLGKVIWVDLSFLDKVPWVCVLIGMAVLILSAASVYNHLMATRNPDPINDDL